MLVGVPALIERPAARLMAALILSVGFLVLQHEYKPYATPEHNWLAQLAGTQITTTLLFIGMQQAVSVPGILGFLCVVLNVIIVPIVIWFNARRLKRRKDILNTFLIEDKENETNQKMFQAKHYIEYWKAGHESEYEVFSATFKWIDGALERPVSHARWGQLLFTLEQLPLTSPENADVRHGAWPGSCTIVTGRRVLSLKR